MRARDRDPSALRAGGLLFSLLAAALPGIPPAHAQEITRPNLAGHTFLSVDIVPEAFVRTYVRNTIGYAEAANIDYPSIVFNGDTLLTLEGDLAFATLSFDYQQAVKDWVAIRLSVAGRTRLGTKLSSLVLDGVTVNAGYELGWLVKVHESKRTMLSGSLGLSNQTYTRIDVEEFVRDVIDGEPNPQIIDDVPALQSFGTGHFSWAISDPFGFTAHVRGLYGETPWEDEPEGWAYDYGGVVDFDAGAAFGVPIGVAVAFRQQSTPLLSNESTGAGRTSNLRIAYNAQTDFIVGLDFIRTWNRDSAREARLTSNGAALTLRYYF